MSSKVRHVWMHRVNEIHTATVRGMRLLGCFVHTLSSKISSSIFQVKLWCVKMKDLFQFTVVKHSLNKSRYTRTRKPPITLIMRPLPSLLNLVRTHCITFHILFSWEKRRRSHTRKCGQVAESSSVLLITLKADRRKWWEKNEFFLGVFSWLWRWASPPPKPGKSTLGTRLQRTAESLPSHQKLHARHKGKVPWETTGDESGQVVRAVDL